MKSLSMRRTFLIVTNSVIEIVWIFALLNVLSAFMQIGDSYLSLLSILTLTMIPLLARIIGPKKSKYPEITSSILVAIGIINILLIILIDLNSNSYPTAIYNALLGFTILSGIWLWYRSTTLATMESPESRLSMTFRVGSAIIIISTISDIYLSTNLHSIPVIIIFYSFGISGLLIGHKIQDENPEGINRKWNIFSFGGLGILLILGILFAFIKKDFWSNYTIYVLEGLFSFFIGIIFAFFGIISWLAKFLTDLTICKGNDCPKLQPADTVNSNTSQQTERTMNFSLEAIAEQDEAKMSILYNVINVIQWAFIIIICLIILFIIYQILKNAFVYAPSGGSADKIKISEEINVFDDIAKMLSMLIPKDIKNLSRFKIKKSGLAFSNAAEAIYIYHQLMDLGKKMGVNRNPSETAAEFQPKLSGIFPHQLVSTVTSYFELALYGNSAISDKEISEMRYQIADLKKHVKQKNITEYQ